MNQGKTVFAQIMSLIPRYEFDKCVKRYNGNRHAIEFKCWDLFMVMSFAQFTDQVCLRCIDATLVALSSKLYSSGIKVTYPTFIYLTEAAVHNSKTMSLIPVEPGSGIVSSNGSNNDCISSRSTERARMLYSRRFWLPYAIICCLPLLRRCIILIKIFIYYRLPLVTFSLKGNL